jgi:hypothetical protein
MISNDEWEELNSLKNAINEYLATVHPIKMERFTELLVKSLEGKGDLIHKEEPTNF